MLRSETRSNERPRWNPAVVLHWAAFLYLSWIYCPIRYCVPTRANVDNSWFFALNYAAAHHLVFGPDIVWTCGPLFYLLIPFHLGSNLPEGLAFQIALWILLSVAFWDVAVHSDFPRRNIQLFTLAMALAAINDYQELYPGIVLVPLALVFLVQFELRGGTARLLAALILMGLVPVFKLVDSVAVAGVVGGFVIHRFVSPRPGGRREAALAILVTSGVAVLSAWLTLRSLDATLAYLKSSREVASGYAFAMSLAGDPKQLYCAFAALGLSVLVLVLLFFCNAKMGQYFVLILSVPILFQFRHAIVRQDDVHVIQFFCFLALVLALIALSLSFDWRVEMASVLTICSFLVLFWEATSLNNFPRTAAMLTGRQVPQLATEVLHYNSLVHSLQDAARKNAAEFGLEPAMRQTVGNESIAFLSTLYSQAVGENLRLSLLPVVQNHGAYTPYLDGRNAKWIEERGPRYLAFQDVAIDNRHVWTEAPQSWAAVYRWYDTRALDHRYLLLERRSQPRFHHFEPIGSQTVHFGEIVPIPKSDRPIFWTLSCSLNRYGRLLSLVFRVPQVNMILTQQNGQKRAYRTLLQVTESPSIGNQIPADLAQFAELFKTQSNPDFYAQSIEFGGPGTTAYEESCQLQFLVTAN